MTALIYIEIEARSVWAAFRVNDIPVWRARGEARQGAGVCLNGLLHGADRLEIGGAWVREAAGPGEGLIAYNLAAYEPGETVGIDGARFVEDRLSDTAPTPAIAYRRDVRSPVDARWAWMAAPAVDAAAPGARAFVERLLAAFRGGDADRLFEAMGPALQDRARAFPEDSPEAFTERLRPGFSLAAPPGDPPPSPADLVLRPAADGRLLEVLDRAGEPFLHKALPDGRVHRLPLLIGRGGPDWAVYR